MVTARAEITESFKNMACSKYQPVPLFYFFDRLYGMFCQFVIGLIHRSITVDHIKVFSSFQNKYMIYFLHFMDFATSRFMNNIWIRIHKTVFQHISIQNLTVVDFGDYKLMQLTEAFLTTNHSEDRSREGRKEGQEIRNLKILLKDIWEAEASWSVGGNF